MRNFIMAIDGPAGSGKSTIAKILAERHNLTYLDTGAMYRMVALYFFENNVDLDNDMEVKLNLDKIKMDIEKDKFILNGKDVSKDIRTPRVSGLVSFVARIKRVREKLVELQREISNGKNVVLDGRDIGTVVFPNAALKIFLVASPEERAKRRMKEYEEKGMKEDFEAVLANIKERDMIDSTREEGPLKKAYDAVEIDTSFMTIDEVSEEISRLVKEKIGE
ncbi:(d)CMP kinase [Fusobacterium perfoetens]|uniref:(d)CMP kinase n=1 Tax=Fusobacterium perfoetens TaxID=852 RepID=UPI00159FD10B|nr:(d)CMP kinase [Fusobacterium perfoetens]MCF2624641.1 (d)CMP kinase [Fusobacterium perfoetens]